MRHKSSILLLVMLFITTLGMKAQSLTVTGKVVDSDGLEVIGANVLLKNSQGVGTITDIDGKFTIQVKNAAKDVLTFSYVGMLTKEVPVKGQKVINVTLESDAIQIEEVVAIGYATAKRKDLTGSVSSVQGGEIGKVPVSSVSQAMAGKIAGVQVTQAQGSPDADVSIRVRGGMSITQSNEPLYIIDGFASDNGMRGLEPSDIASIDVLKDAAATAIYGSAGANGVILITTKSGKEGKANINYDMYIGFKKLTKRLDLLSIPQFVELEYERAMIGGEDDKRNFLKYYGEPYAAEQGTLMEALKNSYTDIYPTYASRKGIDWQDEVFDDNTPLSMNHKISLTGGTKTSNYAVSYARTDDDGIMANSGLSRNNIRARFTQEINKAIRFGVNVSYIDETTEGMGSLNESGQFSRMQHIIQYRPIIGKYGNDEDLLNFQVDPAIDEDSGNQMQNPLVSIEAEERTKRNKSLAINGELSIKVNKYLTYRGTVGLRNRMMSDDIFYNAESRQAINKQAPYGVVSRYDYDTWQYNNTLTYNPRLKKGHSFDLLVGQEDYMQEYKYLSITNTNFPDNNLGLGDISLGTTPEIPQSNHWKYRKISFFGRANYNYKSRYLLTVTLRADGSNRFGENNKWGIFPGASAAWRISDEAFMENTTEYMSNLKLRLGYGKAGNDGIGNYRSLSRMASSTAPFGNAVYPSYGSAQLPNPNVKWETNITANAGIDFGFFNQRLQGSIDVYQNNSKDLLLEMKLPLLSGYKTTIRNVGETRNRGIEFSLTSTNIRTKNFTWETNLNLAHNQNKIKKLTDVDYFTSRSGWVGTSEFNDDDYIVQVGSQLGSMYGYKLQGLYTVNDFNYDAEQKKYILKDKIAYDGSNYPKPGSWKFADVDGDGSITTADKTIIGNANPDVIGGITNNFSYKGFDLSIAFNFQIGGDVYNANRMYFTKMNNRRRNSLSMSADRFTYIDSQTGENIFNNPERLAAVNQGKSMASIDGSSVLKFHSGYIEDASFLRLNNITFGYTLPKSLLKKAYIDNLRLYASAYNLFTITGYSGFDPEVNTKPNGGLTPGVDWGAYPRSLSFVFGLNLSF